MGRKDQIEKNTRVKCAGVECVLWIACGVESTTVDVVECAVDISSHD
jgi:hypothetical protein